MKSFGIVMMCAGVLCTAAPKAIEAAVFSVTQAQINANLAAPGAVVPGSAVSALQDWIAAHLAPDWQDQPRGNANPILGGTFGQHIQIVHESRVVGRPTINKVGRQYIVGTEFDAGQGIPAVTAFLQQAAIANIQTNQVGNRWEVTMTLPQPLDCDVYDPVLHVMDPDGYARRVMADNDTGAAQAWIPAWRSEKFQSLRFNFYKIPDTDNYELCTIFPVSSGETFVDCEYTFVPARPGRGGHPAYYIATNFNNGIEIPSFSKEPPHGDDDSSGDNDPNKKKGRSKKQNKNQGAKNLDEYSRTGTLSVKKRKGH